MFGLDGKRVVVTGAGGGVGTALVAGFAAAGAQVAGCDLPGADLAAADEAHRFDLADREAVQAAAQAICAGGVPDVVVSNAGWTRAETLAQLTPEALDSEMTLNFRGAADLTMALLPAMRRAGGALVFVSSVNAQMHFGNPAYAAAKAGLNAWARAIAAEEGAHGIRANVIMPGSVRTAAWDHRVQHDPGVLDRVAAFFPLGRMVAPREVADAAVFLASSLASGITGVTLPVDGGLTASYMPFVREIA